MVTLVCDTGSRYLSKVYNDIWVAEQGLADRDAARRPARPDRARAGAGDAVTVGPDDTLLTAYNRMRQADVSQLPVLDDGRLIGLIDESDLLEAVEDRRTEARFSQPVATAMTAKLRTLQASRAAGRAAADLRARRGGDRDGRQGVPRPDHPDRPDQLSEARALERRSTTRPRTASPSPPARSTAASSTIRSTGAVMTPIYATSTYAQASPGVHKGFEYSRSQNPTRFALRAGAGRPGERDAGLRLRLGPGGRSARCWRLLDAGDHVIASDDLYGGTFRLFDRVRRRSAGLEFSFVDLARPRGRRGGDHAADAADLGRDADQPAAAGWPTSRRSPRLAQRRGLLAAVDNTFASPYIQRPLELGFDIVMHSTTKYIGGHSDVVGGALVVGENAELRRAAELPAERGRRGRLAVRQLPGAARREDAGAAHAAALRERPRRSPRWLEARAGRASRSSTRACASHPQHELARRQMRGFGGMITVDPRPRPRRTRQAMLERTRLFTLAESLGGVESLIEHPAHHDPRLDPASDARADRHRRRAGPPLGRASRTPTT